jgi:hypothetical protein
MHILSTSEQPPHESITVVKYGEHAFSQIRRFVIVEVQRGFVYAWYIPFGLRALFYADCISPITMYSGRGTLKAGCNPLEHAIIHPVDTQPTWLPGEFHLPNRMNKEPIAIDMCTGRTMKASSRIRFSKAWPIEMNVKVKDIGDVVARDIKNLGAYYGENRRLSIAVK